MNSNELLTVADNQVSEAVSKVFPTRMERLVAARKKVHKAKSLKKRHAGARVKASSKSDPAPFYEPMHRALELFAKNAARVLAMNEPNAEEPANAESSPVLASMLDQMLGNATPVVSAKRGRRIYAD